jgi:hypothetical protein
MLQPNSLDIGTIKTPGTPMAAEENKTYTKAKAAMAHP